MGLWIFRAVVSTLFFYSFTLTNAVPSLHCRGDAVLSCTAPAVRQEWRSASQADRDAYITAVKCLDTLPSRLQLNTTLYNDFPHTHAALFDQIHFVAALLPWHRYWIHIYEQALRNDCGYTGNLLYWDWTLDASDPASSSIWDPTTGLGGNGDAQTGCVNDGPFKELAPSYRGDGYSPHCLRRTFNNGTEQVGDMLGQYYTPDDVAVILMKTNYNDFRIGLENGPHGAVHSGIGGDMIPSTSPNDPIFYLHHTQIDRIWWLWQAADPANRTNDYSGNRNWITSGNPVPPQASLDDILPMLGMAVDITVSDMMNTTSGLLCYTY